jgi:hypothetical protein
MTSSAKHTVGWGEALATYNRDDGFVQAVARKQPTTLVISQRATALACFACSPHDAWETMPKPLFFKPLEFFQIAHALLPLSALCYLIVCFQCQQATS